MRKPRSYAFVAITTLFTLVAAGCDDSSTGNTGDPLTQDEAEFLMAVLFEVGLFTLPDEEDEEFEGDIDFTETCPSGAVSFEGTYEGTQDQPEVGDETLSLAVFIDFLNCAVSDGDDVELTLNGDPGIDFTVDLVAEDGEEDVDISFDGGVEYEMGDDRMGRCAVNLDIAVAFVEEEVDVTATGTACGVPASELGIEDLFEAA